MEAIIERVAGLDVHQSSVVACVIVGAAGRRASRRSRTFGAMRRDLAVPPPEIRTLRELVSHRKALAGTLAAERNRTLQLLEGAGIKLAGVMSDVFGVSGLLMLRALADGTTDAATMADLAKRRLRSKIDQLALALDGQLAAHQQLLLGLHIRRFGESTATWPRSRPRLTRPCSRSPPNKPCS